MRASGRRRRAATAAALAGAALLAGCGAGQPAPDLFVVERSGAAPGSDVELVVSDDGTVSCNGAEPVFMQGDRLLRARELARELERAARLNLELPPGEDPMLSYRARVEAGEIAFTDASDDRPAAFDSLVAFTADVAENVCGIER